MLRRSWSRAVAGWRPCQQPCRSWAASCWTHRRWIPACLWCARPFLGRGSEVSAVRSLGLVCSRQQCMSHVRLLLLVLPDSLAACGAGPDLSIYDSWRSHGALACRSRALCTRPRLRACWQLCRQRQSGWAPRPGSACRLCLASSVTLCALCCFRYTHQAFESSVTHAQPQSVSQSQAAAACSAQGRTQCAAPAGRAWLTAVRMCSCTAAAVAAAPPVL